MESPPVRIGYIRLNSRAKPPERRTAGAAGYDLRACLDDPLEIPPGRIVLVPTGLVLAIPEGFEGQVRARSGLVLRHGLAVLNGPGTVDSDYRGPLGVILGNLGTAGFTVEDGDRIAQIVFSRVPEVNLEELEELPPTERGEGGFGHTGRN
jgi:dUTP pyrophosphatase